MRTGRIAAIAFFLGASVASADTVSLNNGDKVTGVIEEVNPTSIIVTTPYAGKLTIDRKAVKTLKSDKAVMIVGADGAKTEMFVSPTAEGAGAGGGWRETVAVAPPLPPAPPPEPPRGTTFLEISPFWKNQATLGVVNTTGNDQTTSFAASVLFHYLKKPDEFTLKFQGNYGISNGQQNAGLFDENAVYRHDISEKIYAYVDDDVRYDAIKGISLQATATGGPGYWIVRTDKFKFDVRGGPGITYLRTFDGNDNLSPALEAGLRMEYVFNERISASEEAAYTTSLTDFDIWRIHSETALLMKVDLERGLGLKLSFDDDYENQPAAGRKNNDTRLVLSATLDF